MCGILFSNIPGVSSADFDGALNLMTHRGPDAGKTVEIAGGALLGHRRLKILDLGDASNQPFFSEDGRHAIIFNGEIYNYRELKTRFNISTRTSCDTELLLKLYLLHREAALDELNGMFAFVIADTVTGSYFAARDRLGIKPLYIAENDEGVILSSEIAPVLALTGLEEYDEIGLRQYRKLRTFFNGRTFYKGISMFPAGHYSRDGRLTKYWDVDFSPKEPPDDEELTFLIESAVEYRKIADVSVGSYLSGGLDSTVIAALCGCDHTWTVGFASCNEFEWGRMAAQMIGCSHHEVIVSREEFCPTAEKLIKQRKEPLSVPNEVLLYLMTRKVADFNTVILSGEGADELFCGYDRIFRWAASVDEFDVGQFEKLYSYGDGDDIEIVEDALSGFAHIKDPFLKVCAFFQKAHLHGLLRRLDNSTMVCSVEARVPFVDHRLVERLAGVGFDYKMQDSVVKAPLKRIFSNRVPERIISREKVGFPVPLSEILPTGAGQSAMDAWLEFNLNRLSL